MISSVDSVLTIGRALALFGGMLLTGDSEKMVTVRSVADSRYAERRAATNPPPVETYVFAKGTFSPGIVHDNTLAHMPFMRIAETLAYDLRRQNYQPARDFKTTDLVIVVHWGVTLPNDNDASMSSLDPNILSDAISTIEEAKAVAAQDTVAGDTARKLGSVAAAESEYRRTSSEVAGLYKHDEFRGMSNAQLLGFVAALNEADKESSPLNESDRAKTLRDMTNEQRYFIVMMAYDGPALRSGRKKHLWTSRMSIQSAGVNFAMAMDRMSNAGAKFHGTRQESLALEYRDDRPGTVKIGDLKVLNDAEPAKP
jgi:hypothetical protein